MRGEHRRGAISRRSAMREPAILTTPPHRLPALEAPSVDSAGPAPDPIVDMVGPAVETDSPPGGSRMTAPTTALFVDDRFLGHDTGQHPAVSYTHLTLPTILRV